MVDFYHELHYPKEYVGSLRKGLKPKGQLLLLEFKEQDPTVAIKLEHK